MCWSWQANTHIRAERASHNNSLREYFTLGGCAGPGRPIHTYEQREQATITAFDTHDMKPMQSMCKLLYAVFDLSTLTTKIALREYFTLGGCTGPGRPIHTYEQREQATITSFDTHDMKPMQTMCKLLYAVFDLSTLTT